MPSPPFTSFGFAGGIANDATLEESIIISYIHADKLMRTVTILVIYVQEVSFILMLRHHHRIVALCSVKMRFRELAAEFHARTRMNMLIAGA